MSVNHYQPHVLVLPEDFANRQIADSFHSQVDADRLRRMQVLREAGGWTQVVGLFEEVHVAEMDRYQRRFMVLLMDFDNDEGRLERVKKKIPELLIDRVFVLGVLSEPETLRREMGSYPQIGERLGQECRKDIYEAWQHPLLRHNLAELDRLRHRVREILF